MSRVQRYSVIIALILACLTSMVAAPVAEACTVPFRPTVWIVPHEICCPFFGGPCYIRVWIKLHNYFTFGAGPGLFCASCITVGGPIVAVQGATLAYSGSPITGVEPGDSVRGFCFEPNSVVAEQGTEFTGQPTAGFSADVSRKVPEGAAVDLMFDVLLAEDSSLEELQEYLENEGFVVTGEVDENGRFREDGTHLDIVDLEDVQIMQGGVGN